MKQVGRGVARIYVCVVCDNPLNEVTIKNLDPFCSTACCHEYHGVSLSLPGRQL